MAFAAFQNPIEATAALAAYRDAGASPDLALELSVIGEAKSPFDQIMRSADIMWTNRDDLDADGKTLLGRLAATAIVYGWRWIGWSETHASEMTAELAS